MNLSRQLRGLGGCVGVGDPDQDDEANPDRGHGLTVDADGRSAYSLHERSHRTTLSSQAPSPAGGAAVLLIVALPPGAVGAAGPSCPRTICHICCHFRHGGSMRCIHEM